MDEASRGERGTKVGTVPANWLVTPAGRTNAMSPFASRVGTSRTPEPGPAVDRLIIVSFFDLYGLRAEIVSWAKNSKPKKAIR